MTTTPEIHHRPKTARFEAALDDGEAYLAYRDTGELLDFHYVFVSPHLRGGVLAGEVTRAAFEHARAEGRRVRPTCGYVRSWVRRHPEYRELVA